MRALDVLVSADRLLAEDTRSARRLLEIHGVPLGNRPLRAYHDHSGEKERHSVLDAIRGGESVAYVSEAGTPLISDPGYQLVRDMSEAGLGLWAIPGATALVAGLTVAGLPTDKFLFLGFPPTADAARKTLWSEIAQVDATLVFYESPKRVGETLRSMSESLGTKRECVIAREVTKKFEEVRRGALGELAEAIGQTPLKGEVVLMVGKPVDGPPQEAEIDQALAEALDVMKVKDAAALIAGRFALPRRDVYQRALALVTSAKRD